MQKRVAARANKQAKAEAESRALGRAARVSALANQLKMTLLHRPSIAKEVEKGKQGSPTNTTRYRGSFMLSSSQKDMFAHISEISIHTEHRRRSLQKKRSHSPLMRRQGLASKGRAKEPEAAHSSPRRALTGLGFSRQRTQS